MRPDRPSHAARWWRLGIGGVLLLAWALAHGGPESAAALAVIYPDLGEPYRSVFSEILTGIKQQARATIPSYPIGANMDAAELNEDLKRRGTRVVIALGRQGVKTASGLDRNLAVVVGGVLSVPEAELRRGAGISLTPAPDLLFARLKALLPGVKRVIVIYNPQHNEWLMALAREAAKAEGLELVTQEARDLSAAARLYQAAFATVDKHRDAIWLPQDATAVDEDTILPLVLKEAWSRGVAVFSSSLLHVRKGVLFALYPDNQGLGRALAQTAQGVLAGEARPAGMSPLRAVRTAVNLRTASHLGLNLSYAEQRSFDSVFPEP